MAEVDKSTSNIFSGQSPQVVGQNFVDAKDSIAGGDTPRTFSRQLLTGNMRGIQQFGTPNLFANAGDNYFGVSKDSVNQVLMGNQPTFGEGFYVSVPGKDVSKATDFRDFIFNSNQDTLQVVLKGVAGLQNNGEPITTLSVYHGLGFTPIPLGFLNNSTISSIGSGISYPLANFTGASIDTINNIVNFSTWLYVAADNQYFYAQLLNSTGSPLTYYITYYLLRETVQVNQ